MSRAGNGAPRKELPTAMQPTRPAPAQTSGAAPVRSRPFRPVRSGRQPALRPLRRPRPTIPHTAGDLPTFVPYPLAITASATTRSSTSIQVSGSPAARNLMPITEGQSKASIFDSPRLSGPPAQGTERGVRLCTATYPKLNSSTANPTGSRISGGLGSLSGSDKLP